MTLRFGTAGLRGPVGERLPTDQLAHEVRRSVGRAPAVGHLRDVLVGGGGGAARLLLESPDGLGVAAELGVPDLERHALVGRDVVSLVDAADPSITSVADDSVFAFEDDAGQEGPWHGAARLGTGLGLTGMLLAAVWAANLHLD